MLIRGIQERTGGFTEFVPLPFVHQLAPIYLAGVARPGSTFLEDRRVHALARVLLAGAIDNLQLSWVKLGLGAAGTLLRGGCNDLGGTLMEETISRMAGSTHGVRQTPADLAAAAWAVGRPVAQRRTDYALVGAPRGPGEAGGADLGTPAGSRDGSASGDGSGSGSTSGQKPLQRA
jgi:FO synthase